jgi:ribosome biogenesis SPOUT family RNA methylase Rps3
VGDISKSTIHKWEGEKSKVCGLSDEQLRSIYLELRNEIINQIGKKMDRMIVKDFSANEEISPLSIEKNNLVAV